MTALVVSGTADVSRTTKTYQTSNFREGWAQSNNLGTATTWKNAQVQMETFFFDQLSRRRRQSFRKTAEDLKASRRERPLSAGLTRIKFEGAATNRERSDRDGRQGQDNAGAGGGVRFPGLVKLPKVFEELRSNPTAIPSLPSLSPKPTATLSPRAFSQSFFLDEHDEDADDQRAAFERLQFSAPKLLSQLARLLYGDLPPVTLPPELRASLCRDFSELASGAKTQPREWQTEVYRDMAAMRLQQQQEEEERLANYTDDARSTIAGDTASVAGSEAPRRRRRRNTLDDAASIISSVPSERKRSTESIKSGADISEVETASSVLFRDHEDPGPLVLRYRRESRTPRYDVQPPTPRTRLEKFTRAKGKHASALPPTAKACQLHATYTERLTQITG